MDKDKYSSDSEQDIPTSDIENQEHIFKLWQPFSFTVKKGYDYLRGDYLTSALYWFFRALAHIILNIFNRVMFGYKVLGIENVINLSCGAVIVSNHVHPMDCTFIDCALFTRRAYYPTLQSNFQIPIARHLIRFFDGVPIPKNFHLLGEFNAAMKTAIENGNFVVIYPEGVLRPYYKDLCSFKNGAFALAASVNAPILPIAITFRSPQGIFRIFKRKPLITLNILPPVKADDILLRAEKIEYLKEECLKAIKDKISD